ncbi:MAG: hypothetical protein JO182_22675, partial [Acidobacteriaceae bacterium]|nr:hypothetical protein [Acidobacteriaceae bacterium]
MPVSSVLPFRKVMFDEIQAEHAKLEAVGQAAKERRFVAELELIKGSDDGVRLLTSFHIINKGVEASPFPVNMGDVFREEAHEKERVVADVFSDFTL